MKNLHTLRGCLHACRSATGDMRVCGKPCKTNTLCQNQFYFASQALKQRITRIIAMAATASLSQGATAHKTSCRFTSYHNLFIIFLSKCPHATTENTLSRTYSLVFISSSLFRSWYYQTLYGFLSFTHTHRFFCLEHTNGYIL